MKARKLYLTRYFELGFSDDCLIGVKILRVSRVRWKCFSGFISLMDLRIGFLPCSPFACNFLNLSWQLVKCKRILGTN
jgi:hypothetical protein